MFMFHFRFSCMSVCSVSLPVRRISHVLPIPFHHLDFSYPYEFVRWVASLVRASRAHGPNGSTRKSSASSFGCAPSSAAKRAVCVSPAPASAIRRSSCSRWTLWPSPASPSLSRAPRPTRQLWELLSNSSRHSLQRTPHTHNLHMKIVKHPRERFI